MTVSTTTNKIIYAGLTGQSVFAYNFRVDEKTDMNVFLAGTIIDQGDWSIDGLGDDSGGDVTLLTPLVADVSVTLLREVDETQLVDYLPFDAFPAETHEGALDKLTFLTQQLQEQVDRGVSLPIDTPLDGYDIGVPVANMVIQYKGDETGQESSGINATTFNANVQAAADSAAASAAAASASADFRDKSQEWAENPEDTPVETGPDEFSALHWAAKAAGIFDAKLEGYESNSLHKEYAADLDDILINSKFFIDSTSVTNEPADFVGLGVIETDLTVAGTDQAVQLLTTMDAANEGAAFIRHREGGAWSEWLSFGSGGGLSWEFPIGSLVAEAGVAYMFPSVTVTDITLPADPEDGDAITFADLGDTWDGSINIDGNGKDIEFLTDIDLETAGGVLELVYAGTQWEIVGLIDGVYRGATPPAAPQAVGRWWDINNGLTYIWYFDGDSSQWVQEQAGSHAGDPGPLEIFVNGVPVDSDAGQTFIDFPIPAGVKQVTLVASRFSAIGSSRYLITMNGETVDYFGSASTLGAAVTTAGTGGGFLLISTNNTSSIHEIHTTFTLLDAATNLWGSSGTGARTDAGAETMVSGGSKVLAQELNTLRFTTQNGTDTFQAGKINVQYDNPGQLPNIVPPGTVVGFASTFMPELVTGTAVIVATDALIQISAGAEVIRLAYTPKFANSILKVESAIETGADSVVLWISACLFEDGDTDSLAGDTWLTNFAGGQQSMQLLAVVPAVDVTPKGFSVRVGGHSGAAWGVNGSTARRFGGVASTYITITEIAQ